MAWKLTVYFRHSKGIQCCSYQILGMSKMSLFANDSFLSATETINPWIFSFWTALFSRKTADLDVSLSMMILHSRLSKHLQFKSRVLLLFCGEIV